MCRELNLNENGQPPLVHIGYYMFRFCTSPITYSHLYFLECFSTDFSPNLELFIQYELLCAL